nr:MAG TPA: putative heavy-metal chelation protein [Caudoviricetes sp.]
MVCGSEALLKSVKYAILIITGPSAPLRSFA